MRSSGEGHPGPSPRPGEVSKTFLGHLMELRARIILCVLAVVLAMIAALVFHQELSSIIQRPVEDYNATVVDEESKVRFLTTRVQEAFIFILKIGLWGGLLLASPIMAWQVWSFVSPGLYVREKRAVLPIFTVGLFFFAGGAYYAYRFVMPLALAYLLPFAGKLGAEARLTLSEYFRFFLMVHVAFGLAFETPLVVLGLARAGLVTARGLLVAWRYIVVGAFVLGAVLTPPDYVTQILMAGCLLALYAISVLLAWVFGTGGERAPDSES